MGKAYAHVVSFCYLRLPFPLPPRFDIELAFESSAQALPGALYTTVLTVPSLHCQLKVSFFPVLTATAAL